MPTVYHLNNGSTWSSGTGSFPIDGTSVKFVAETVNGSTIQYFLAPTSGATYMEYTDYDSGSHSSNGQLARAGRSGARCDDRLKHGNAAGLTRPSSSTRQPIIPRRLSITYSAPVGSQVPITGTYTLQGGATWNANTFNGSFNYSDTSSINFSQWVVPEPSTFSLLGSARSG